MENLDFNKRWVIAINWWEGIIRLIISMIAGGIVGAQRELNRNAAGLRTHILVALGACIAMLLNEFLFRKYSGISNIDIGRMGSYVISGIGFLGAGSIIKDGFSVMGLTTAAGLWVVACLGIAIGAGYYLVGVSGTVMTILVLTVLKLIEKKYMDNKNDTQIELRINNTSKCLVNILSILDQEGFIVKSITTKETETKWASVNISTSAVKKMDINNLYSLIEDTKGVKNCNILSK